MDPLIDLIRNNPILVVFLGIWLLSIFGNVLTKAARKAAEQQRRQAQKRAQVDPGQRPPLPGQRREAPTQARQAASPTTTRARRPATQAPTRPAVPTAEDIAAEIRRVMGMEEPPQRAPAPEPPPPPPPEDPGFTTQAGFEHFAEGVGGLHSGVDPHVGEGVSKRHTPASGAVGRRELGSLGGRVHRQVQRKVVRRRRYDLSDPAAAIVTLEILGKPRALRDFEF